MGFVRWSAKPAASVRNRQGRAFEYPSASVTASPDEFKIVLISSRLSAESSGFLKMCFYMP
ncbi:hypothetical protein [Bdellovibrio sp. HCB288]|uniref:hypothetical protein n=1 Tax=Bdellovibrio sp. HCB288 TaxID=3394355 RepID=UPI0039B5A390